MYVRVEVSSFNKGSHIYFLSITASVSSHLCTSPSTSRQCDFIIQNSMSLQNFMNFMLLIEIIIIYTISF